MVNTEGPLPRGWLCGCAAPNEHGVAVGRIPLRGVSPGGTLRPDRFVECQPLWSHGNYVASSCEESATLRVEFWAHHLEALSISGIMPLSRAGSQVSEGARMARPRAHKSASKRATK